MTHYHKKTILKIVQDKTGCWSNFHKYMVDMPTRKFRTKHETYLHHRPMREILGRVLKFMKQVFCII